jgi:succinylglutamate desuccinylase
MEYDKQEVVKSLLIEGGFLALSRSAENLLPEPLCFKIAEHTLVNVIAEGIISFEPFEVSDKDVVLSCGIHGNETAPIEICDEIVKDILLENIVVAQRVLFIFGNLKAMDIAQRFVVENMNRLFSGAHDTQPTNYERGRAKKLEQVVADFYTSKSKNALRTRFHYDLHTAIRASKNDKFAVYPFLHDKPWDKTQLQILLACGVNTILLSGNPTTTFSYYSSHNFDAHAFTVELGKVKPFGQNDMSQFSQVDITLRRLITSKRLQLKEYVDTDFCIYKVNQVINKQQADFELNFSDDSPNFSDFPKGTILASETGCEYRAEYEGEAIVFPNADVEIGQRALLTVIPTQI